MNDITKAVKNIEKQLNGTEPVKEYHMEKVGGLVKKSAGRKIAEAFFDEDLDDFKKTFFKDMLRPALKDFAFSIIQRLFYGGGPKVNSGGFINLGSSLVRDYTPSQRTNYNNPQSTAISQSNGKFDFSDLIFTDLPYARNLVNKMNATIASQGYVSVSDLYDSLDKIDGLDITDNYWGWYSLQGHQIRPVKSGYRVFLPQPVQLNK